MNCSGYVLNAHIIMGYTYKRRIIILQGGRVKQKELVRKLLKAGFEFYDHGSSHDRYKKGDVIETIPRHREVNERLANAILKRNGIK